MTHLPVGRRAIVALLASFAATGAFAQAKYPDHPITVVVPFAAGSATDQLARALGQHPALLLCDEPTGQLDSDTGARILDLIDALQREFGFALMTATHDEDVAARHDRVLELEEGRVVRESA